jgi:tetratricopeptide (TPR) repeat protein
MNRWTKFALTLPLVLAPFAFAGDLEDAQALQAAGKFAEALPKYEAAAKADATNPAAALGLSQVLAGLGRYDEAAKAVDAARKANPGNAALCAAKGRAYMLAAIKEEASEEPDGGLIDGLRSDAVRWAGEALKADPKNLEALLLRGQLYLAAKDEKQAQMFFEQAISTDPKSFDANFELANLWYVKANADRKNMDLWAKAESGFFTCWKLDPKSARAAANLAHCKAWQNMPKKDVAAAYERALNLAPADENVLKHLYTWTPAEEKVATMQRLAAAQPRDVARMIYLARAHMSVKEHGKAFDVLEKASQIEPKNPRVPYWEGEVALDEGKNLDKAVDFYAEAISLYKDAGSIDNATYIRIAGPIAFEHPKLEKGHREKLWTYLWKYFPERSDAMNNAGFWFRDFGKDYEKSIEWYLRAAKAAPEDVCILNDTGLIYHYHMNDFDKAEPFYRQAVKFGNEQGLDCTVARKEPDRGFHDAINNLHIILAKQNRWKDLKQFVEDDVPAKHPMRELWLKEAEGK